MKKNKLIFIATLSTAFLFSLASCQGAQGPKGDQGEQGQKGEKGETGEKGEPGTNGVNGQDGNSILNGKGEPSTSLGNDGDSYIDTDSFDFYAKEEGKWVKKGNLKGGQGNQGEQGEEGKSGSSVLNGKGEPSTSLGKDGDSYIDTSSFDYYVKSSGKWSKKGNIKGTNGKDGTNGSNGRDGKTYYSNTILPSVGGYVKPNLGSASYGESITFTMIPNEGYSLKSLSLNDNKYYVGDSKLVLNESTGYYDCTVNMVTNGFVVQAEFVYGKYIPEPPDVDGEELTEEDWIKAFEVDASNLTFGEYYYNSDGIVYNSKVIKKVTNDDGKILMQKTESGDNFAYVDVLDKTNNTCDNYIQNDDESWSTYNEQTTYYQAINAYEDENEDGKTKQDEYFNSFNYFAYNFGEYFSKFTYSRQDGFYHYEEEYGYLNVNDIFSGYNNSHNISNVDIKFENGKVSKIKIIYGSDYVVYRFTNYATTTVENPLNDIHIHQYEQCYDNWRHWKKAKCEHSYNFEETTNYERHTLDDNDKCTVCGYKNPNYNYSVEDKRSWLNIFERLRDTTYTYSNVTLNFGGKEWQLKKSYCNSNEQSYIANYLKTTEQENYYYTYQDENDEYKTKIALKYYENNGKWDFKTENEYNSSQDETEKSWNLEYAFTNALLCPDLTNFYDKFQYDSANEIYYYEGDKDNALATNKLLDLDNSYTLSKGEYYSRTVEYTSKAYYYNIKVKIRNNHISWISFNSTDENLGDGLIKIDFHLNDDNSFEIPEHTHKYSQDWTASDQAYDYYDKDTDTWKSIYGHYHKSLCLDDEEYKNFTPHNYSDGTVCSDCGYDSRKVNESGFYNSFNKLKDESTNLTANITWNNNEITYKYKCVRKNNEEKYYLCNIKSNSEEWIIKYSYSRDSEVVIYKKDDNNWQIVLNSTYKELVNDDYYSYLLSKSYVIPNLNSYDDFTYSDYKWNLKSEISINCYNILLKKPSNYDFYNYFYASYTNISLSFGSGSDFGSELKEMSFKVSNNELFGDNLVTIKFSYDDVSIDIPSDATPIDD